MTISHWKKPSQSTPDTSVDVLIVGGGYVGLSTAYWLTQLKPQLKIAVIDRRFCGAGASGRNAGFLTKGSATFYQGLALKWDRPRATELYEFAKCSLELAHEHLLLRSGISFEMASSMTLIRSETQHQALLAEGFSPEKFQFSWKDKKELPFSLQSKFIGAYENSPEYKINPAALLEVLKKEVLAKGVELIEGSTAFEITTAGVQTDTHFIRTSRVVLALNGYFPQFHEVFKGSIVPRRAQMLAVELETEFDCPSLYYDSPERVYWRKDGEKVLLIGGKRLLDEAGEVGDFEKISPKIQKGLEDYLREQLGIKYKVIDRWSGTMGFTDHELPLAGKIKAPLETYIIGGFSGHGMGLGFLSGKDLAEQITGLKNESFFDRFKKMEFSL